MDRLPPLRRDSTSMQPMNIRRESLPMGPLTRSEEILQFERLRHQIHIVEALRGLKITRPVSRAGQSTTPRKPWSQLRNLHFDDLITNKVQEDSVLKCRTVVEPLLFGSLQVLVEHVEGGYKVMMVAIENFVNETNVMELSVLFPPGREFWIRDPCVKSHEGRPWIVVEDPVNLKFRQSAREIERLLEYGPVDGKGWKIKGSELVKRGKLQEAFEAYGNGIIHAGFDNKLRASLYRRRAQILFDMGHYQAARREAAISLRFHKKDKTLVLLARALLELRSYTKALETIEQVTERDDYVEKLFLQLSTCDQEYKSGKYDLISIAKEAHVDDRVVHADFVSPDVELRTGGVAGRGLFAAQNLDPGTLLIASKPVLSLYVDEVPNGGEFMSLGDAGKGTFEKVREEFVDRLVKMLKNGNARRILQLAGGSHAHETTFDLRRDDVYDEEVFVNPLEVTQIVARNSFGGSQRSEVLANGVPDDDVGGAALFFAPSFLNHSCIPNTSYFTVGDMMFIKANQQIEEGEELTIHYLHPERWTEQERSETLERVWGFTCQCELCEWERENQSTCLEASEIVDKVLAFSSTATPEAAIKKFASSIKKLYQLYRVPTPDLDALTVLEHPPSIPPPSLALNLIKLYREAAPIYKKNPSVTDNYIPIMVGYHFLIKYYSHFERVGIAGLPALRVWQHLTHNSSASKSVLDAWLKEAQISHDMLLGEGNFEYQHKDSIENL